MGHRRLDALEVVYLWVDGVYVKAGLEREKAALLIAVAGLSDGRKVVVAVVPGARESGESLQRENVVAHLPKRQQATWRQKLQRTYEQPTHAEAKATLDRLARELQVLNESAARFD